MVIEIALLLLVLWALISSLPRWAGVVPRKRRHASRLPASLSQFPIPAPVWLRFPGIGSSSCTVWAISLLKFSRLVSSTAGVSAGLRAGRLMEVLPPQTSEKRVSTHSFPNERGPGREATLVRGRPPASALRTPGTPRYGGAFFRDIRIAWRSPVFRASSHCSWDPPPNAKTSSTLSGLTPSGLPIESSLR